jgi:hypothetical protein
MPKIGESRGRFEIENGTSRILFGAVFLLIGFFGFLAYYLSVFRGLFDSKYFTGDVFLGLFAVTFLGVVLAYSGRVAYGNALKDWEVGQEHELRIRTEENREGIREAIHSPKMVVETGSTGPNR